MRTDHLQEEYLRISGQHRPKLSLRTGVKLRPRSGVLPICILGIDEQESISTRVAHDNMATPAARRERQVHQDYIARIRYENKLPPPPGPPKLLDIPTEGLAYYASPAFASRLARQQPLNIEADAFLGMPIDLVGMPGIFDGDESCKQWMFKPTVDVLRLISLRSYPSCSQPPSSASQGQSFTAASEVSRSTED